MTEQANGSEPMNPTIWKIITIYVFRVADGFSLTWAGRPSKTRELFVPSIDEGEGGGGSKL